MIFKDLYESVASTGGRGTPPYQKGNKCLWPVTRQPVQTLETRQQRDISSLRR
jgi:hypothetical protein